MNVALLVPRRAGDAHRDRLWEIVQARWREGGWSPVEGHHVAAPFNRSAALNAAARDAGDWDVAVIADADTLVPLGQARDAADIALSAGVLALAHTRYIAMTSRSTRRFLDSGTWKPVAKWEMTNAVSGCLAVPRSLWEEVGGFDERFRGWGYEDRAFFCACNTLGGHERAEGEIHHLWHPRSPERDPDLPDYQAAQALATRYKRAHGDEAAIRELLAER